jgi:6-pyruvoyl-tetrahydropterin synthase
MIDTTYLRALSPGDQIHRGRIRYEYRIGAHFTRRHANPPLWTDLHEHTFHVTLELAAERPETGLYGLDMVALERRLNAWAEMLPPVLNDCPECPHGTTEELCHYFARLPLEDHAVLLSVAVAEVPERITVLRCG